MTFHVQLTVKLQYSVAKGPALQNHKVVLLQAHVGTPHAHCH